MNVISSKSEFIQIIRAAKKIRCSGNLFFYRSNNIELARFAVTVSKKRFAKAVVRNRVKRLHRAAFQRFSRALVGYDIIVMPEQLQTFTETSFAWEQLCQSL